MKRLLGLILFPLVLSGCNTAVLEPEISLQIIGEWQCEDVISGGTVGEINGRMYLFLITHSGGGNSSPSVLRILDLQDSVAPVEVAALPAPIGSTLPVMTLRLSGTLLYIQLGGVKENGLWVVDASTPASPREVSFLDMEYPVFDFVLSGKIAIIQRFPSRMFLLVDITDPANPRHLGEFDLSREQDFITHSGGTDVSGSLFYVVDRDGLDIVDISLPSSPREIGFYANPLWTGEEPDVIEDPSQGTSRRVPISGIEDLVPGGFRDVAVSGEYVCIADVRAGLRVMDVSDPMFPREVAQLGVPEAAYRITVFDNLLYLLGMEMIDKSFLHAIHIVDISEPENPVIVDSIEDIRGLPLHQSLIATERYVYFINVSTLTVIDIYALN